MDGSIGSAAEQVYSFIERLKEKFSIPIDTWDERLSTVAAERALLEADMSRGKRKKVIDKVAAVLILQGYLDYLSMKGTAAE
jgi:putative Holliday junction resolvase